MRAGEIIKMPQAGDGVSIRLVNPRPIKFRISHRGHPKEIYRWSFWAQTKPFVEAKPGLVKLIEMGRGVHDQIEDLRKSIGTLDTLRSRELCFFQTGRSHDRFTWKLKVIDCGSECSFPEEEVNAFSHDALLDVIHYRQKLSVKQEDPLIHYHEICNKYDDEHRAGRRMEDLFDPNSQYDTNGVPKETPAQKEYRDAQDAMQQQRDAAERAQILTAEMVNVALYDARMTKAPRGVTEPLLLKWLELTGRRQPGWW